MNARLYLMILGADVDRAMVIRFLDERESVRHWFYSMPNSVFFSSTESANEIRDALFDRLGSHRLFISEVSRENRAGRMPTSHWQKVSMIETGH